MSLIRNFPKLILMSLIVVSVASGCKSKKKAMEAAAEKARMEQEAAKKEAEMERRMKEAEERAKREAELKEAAEASEKKPDANTKLSQYFDAISGSTNVTSANKSISEALTMFASPETPVLIVISQSGDQKDYDRPTTIKQYLNYLKDQKKNINEISDMKMDASGKITELELVKNL